MTTTRRDLFKFGAGAGAGLVFTPAPWRVITDGALWSENQPWIPRPARGEIRTRFTHCALCPAGCGVRARCVGDQPVSLLGLTGEPLCALGLTGHQLPYHPARVHGREAGAAATIQRGVAEWGARESVAVLDLRPGRTASWTYRRAMARLPHGLYLAPKPILPAVDLAKARTVLSVGTPVLDGWGTPGNVLAERAHFRLIQAEAFESHTAAMADAWLPIRPGSERALALGIAKALGGEGIPVIEAASRTGLAEQRILALARELKENGPSLVLAREESPAILGLNGLLGNSGTTVVARREAPVPASWNDAAPVTDLASVRDGSIRVLLIDEGAPGAYIPWATIERKLVAQNRFVVTFAPFRSGYARHADYVLPSAVYPEAAGDVPQAVDSVRPRFRLTAPLVAAPEGMVNPAEFVAGLAGVPAENALRERADAIHKAGQGTLRSYAEGRSAPVSEVTADEFWKILNEGGSWTGPEQTNLPRPALHLGGTEREPLREDSSFPLIAVVCDGPAMAGSESPLMSKLYRESSLRISPGSASLNPRTAAEFALRDACRATLATRCGKLPVTVAIDSGVPPGAVLLAATPGVLDICGATMRAKVVRS